jgi:hypothetical protein
MYKLVYIGLFMAALMLTACESNVTNVSPPQVDPELVVFSFISPEDDSILVEVRMTTPIFSGGDLSKDRVTDAQVRLRAVGGAEIVIPHQGNGRYTIAGSTFQIQAGQQYQLLVNTPNGYQASAFTTVPFENPAITAIDTFNVPAGFGFNIYLARASWQDLPGKHYYRLSSRQLYTTPNGDTLYSILDNSLLSDSQKENQLLQATVEYYPQESDSLQTANYELLLLTTDENYYKYHQRRFQYTGDNPFEEPLPMFDNIDGGTGCFGSYRLQKRNF